MRASSSILVSLLPLLLSACEDGQRIPLGEQRTNSGGSSSSRTPATGGSSTTPATGGSSSIPPTTRPCDLRTQVCHLTLDIKPYRTPCMGVGLVSCMLTRENDVGDYGNFYDAIRGFSFEWGYAYRLRVETTPVPDPPADGSSIDYRLIELSAKTPVAASTEFEVALAPLVDTTEALGLVFSGDCSSGYTLFGKPINFDAGLSCESFRAITSATIPNSVRLEFSTPEGPLRMVGITPQLQLLEIRPDLHGCLGYGGPAPLPCKWARSNGFGEFRGLWEPIYGFDFQWGYDYELVVDRRTIPNPANDGPLQEYTLLQLVKKTPVAPGTEFEFDLTGYTPVNLQYAVSGNCTLGYKLLTTNGPDLAFDAGVACESFANAIATTVPRAIKLRFSNPGDPLSVVSLL